MAEIIEAPNLAIDGDHIRVNINGFNYTPYLNRTESSFSLIQNLNSDDSLVCTLVALDNMDKYILDFPPLSDDRKKILLNSEIKIYYGKADGTSFILFGGFIKTFNNPVNGGTIDERWTTSLNCVGYKDILKKTTVTYFYTETIRTYSDLVRRLVTTHLSVNGVTLGNIDESEALPLDYSFLIGSAEELMNEICNLTGYFWNIGANKKLNFFQKMKYEAPVDLKTSFTITNSNQDATEYLNKVFITDGTNSFVVEDTTEINKMKTLGGNGVFGGTIRSRLFKNPLEASKIATQLLLQRSYFKQTFNINYYGYLPIGTTFNFKWQGYNYVLLVKEYKINLQGIAIKGNYTCENIPMGLKQLNVFSSWVYTLAQMVTINGTNGESKERPVPWHKTIRGQSLDFTLVNSFSDTSNLDKKITKPNFLFSANVRIEANSTGYIYLLIDGSNKQTLTFKNPDKESYSEEPTSSNIGSFELEAGKHTFSIRINGAINVSDVYLTVNSTALLKEKAEAKPLGKNSLLKINEELPDGIIAGNIEDTYII